MKRGIVIGPTFKKSSESDSQTYGSINYSFNLDDLRFLLLFWDIIDVTCFERFSMRDSFIGPSNPDIDFLIGEGIASVKEISQIEIRKIIQKPLYIQEFIEYEQIAVLLRNSKRSDEEWSIFQKGKNVSIPKKISLLREVTEFKLINLLPVPSRDVPIEEVLEFREKHKPELLTLRDAIDGYTSRICNAEQPNKEYKKVKLILEQSLNDYYNVLKENNKFSCKMVLKSFSKIATDPVFAISSLITNSQLFNYVPENLHFLKTLVPVSVAIGKFVFKKEKYSDLFPERLKNYAYLVAIERNLF